MYGWLITNNKINEYFQTKEYETFSFEEYNFVRLHNGRFKDDTLFCETEKYFVIIDGIVLNKKELVDKYKLRYLDIIIKLYEEKPACLPKTLRGPFSGMIFDKSSKSIFAFTNHTGDSGVFYSLMEDSFIISNNYNWISDLLEYNDYRTSLDETAVKYMLSFGFMLDETTFVSQIKRLLPSNCLTLFDEEMVIEEYHIFDNFNTINMEEEQIIEQIDLLFRQAIKREFEKDIEYGFCSVVDLSGGLDSRVINYVAKNMGYKNILNISFSQVYSNEYKATIEVSRDLGFKLFHYPLDNATHLYDLDKIVKHNYGLSFYAGAGALMSIMENINLSFYGLEHGGVMGEMAHGVFPGPSYIQHKKPSFEEGMPFFGKRYLNLLSSDLLDKYNNLEQFTIIGRGLMGGACPQLIRRNYTGYVSPFEDIDFYDYFISIPVEIRGTGNILQKWINKKYPEAFNIIEDKLMCKPNASKLTKKRKILVKRINNKINRLLGDFIPKLRANNMNPMDYWYKTNSTLRSFINNYYDDYIGLLDDYPNSKLITREMFESDNTNEKLAALTVLSAVKQFIR